jgi:iron(III) transport system substrate-binding protein
MDRRTFLKAVAASTLAAATPHRAMAEEATLYEAAKKEGQITWYTAHTDGETAEAMGRAFTAKYPGVAVTVVRTTAQTAYQRLSEELKNDALQCDVFSSTDVGHYVALKAQSRFAHYVPENAAKVSPEFQNFDKDGFYYPTSAGLIGITYNTRKVKPEDAPQSWPDLLLPKWKNQVSIGHPAFSGYVGTWVVTMRKLYGWDFFDKLEKNNPQIGRSINDTVTMLNSGERSVAAGPTGTTLASADKGNPLAIVYPSDGAVLIIAPSAVMAKAQHPNAARLYMEFLLSVEGNEVTVKQRGESLRPEVQPLPGAKPLAQVKVVRPTVDEIVEGIPQVIEQWRDTFGN